MLFVRTTSRASRPADSSTFPVVCLAPERWDDHGFRTTFYATLYVSSEQVVALGRVKILHREQQVTTLDQLPASELDEDHVSVFQEPDTYERFVDVERQTVMAVLSGLRDAAIDPSREARFAQQAGWRLSLLRFMDAKRALLAGRRAFVEGWEDPPAEDRLAFTLASARSNRRQLQVDVSLDGSRKLGRITAIAGVNGTGKTTLLADLAARLSGLGGPELATLVPDVGPIDVVAVSYSAFDAFSRRARLQAGGYRYCGLRDFSSERPGSVDVEGARARVAEAFLLATPSQFEELRKFLQLTGIARANRIELEDVPDAGLFAGFESWSAGHQVVTLVYASLVLHVQEGTLVLFDEPETHLHPGLLSSLLRSLHALLEIRKAFCIVATHSAVVLQEVPSRFIRILERIEDRIEVRVPAIQTFGADLSDITSNVFNIGLEEQNFVSLVRAWTTAGTSREAILAEFDENPSLAVRSLARGTE